MATYIQETLAQVDTAVAGYAETVFIGWAGDATIAIQAAGLVSLCFVALNTMFALAPVRASDYLKWGLRYVIVLSVATSWAQFLPFYRMLTDLPSSIGAELIDVTDAPTLNAAMDAMVTAIFDFSDRAASESSWFSISLSSVVLIILGAGMACVAILVSAFAKPGLAMAVSLAPVFIGTLLVRGTSDLFTAWSRFTLGFAMIPIVLAGVMGAVIGIGEDLIAEAEGATILSQGAGFLIVAFGAIVMMSQVPTMVNGLAGGIVATASTMQTARTGSAMVARPVSAAAREVAKRLPATSARVSSAIGAGKEAEPGRFAKRAMEDWKHTGAAREASAEKLRIREAEFGRQTTRSQRAEAARAGGRQQAHLNAKARTHAKQTGSTAGSPSQNSNPNTTSQASQPRPRRPQPGDMKF